MRQPHLKFRVVTLNAFQLAWKCIDLLRGRWQQPDRLLEIVWKVFGLAAVLASG